MSDTKGLVRHYEAAISMQAVRDVDAIETAFHEALDALRAQGVRGELLAKHPVTRLLVYRLFSVVWKPPPDDVVTPLEVEEDRHFLHVLMQKGKQDG